jgi:hypothetical protein
MDEGLEQASVPVVFDALWNEEATLGAKLARRPPSSFNREQQAKDIVEVFQIIGGVPRFAHWANEHPGYFYTKLFTKTLPQGASMQLNAGSINIVYQAAIPQSPLDEATDVEYTEVTE